MGSRWGMAGLGSRTWPKHLNTGHIYKLLLLRVLRLILAPFVGPGHRIAATALQKCGLIDRVNTYGCCTYSLKGTVCH
jgi:hypothetical protein